MDVATEARVVDIGLPLQGGEYSYFTGYVISNGLILTCLHGFKGNYDDSAGDTPENLEYDPTQKISINSSGFDTEIAFEANGFDELVDEGFFAYVSDEFSETYDVVIFKCAEAKAPSPQKLQRSDLFVGRRRDWHSGGFPFFNRNNTDTYGYRNFSGVYSAPPSMAINLELTVQQPELPRMSDWGSASGSPVFIRGELAGILRRFTRYEDDTGTYRVIPNQLEASYLRRLWEEDPSFKAFFEFQDPSQKVVRHVLSFLTEPTCASLVSALGGDTPKAVVTRLQGAPLTGFLDDMGGVSGTPIGTRKSLTNAFVPYYFNDQALLIEQTHTSPAVDLECIREIAAEYAMSAFSGRKANVDYRGEAATRSGELYVTANKFALAAMPESGIGHISNDKAALAEDYKRRRALPDIAVDKERLSINAVSLEQYTISRLADYMQGEQESDAIDEVNALLEEDSQKNIHYYMVVKIDKNTDNGKQALELIEGYKDTFPELVFINLAASRMDERERLLHRKLPGIITE